MKHQLMKNESEPGEQYQHHRIPRAEPEENKRPHPEAHGMRTIAEGIVFAPAVEAVGIFQLPPVGLVFEMSVIQQHLIAHGLKIPGGDPAQQRHQQARVVKKYA